MELGGRHFKWHKGSMEYSMEFNGIVVPPNEIKLSSMEFHGIFHGTLVPPNEIWLCCKGIPWNFEVVILINTMLPLICMDYSMELHGTLESPNKKWSSSTGFHGIRRAPYQMTHVFFGIPWNIPWNSMELWYRQMKYHLVPWNSI